MALVDTLSGTITADISLAMARSVGSMNGMDVVRHVKQQPITDGTAVNQASGWFSSSFTATTGGITLSLANLDPLGGAGDDAPSGSAEGLKLRAILVENTDATNFVSFKRGTNGESSMLSGTTDSIKITAGGMLLWTSPAGVSAMNDGADDEFLVTADTASCIVKLSYVFG